ncbi:MAG: hypothetical protein ACJAZ2_001713 [Glaciecola sp.]|jgi:hypothetical protein
MKNALLLFIITLPMLIINQLAFDFESGYPNTIIFMVPFIGLNLILKKTHSHYSKEEVFKKVFKTCLITGLCYAIWIGSYQFVLFNYIDPELAKKTITIAKSTNNPLYTNNLNNIDISIYRNPIHFVSTYLILNSFFFSLIGLTLGFLFKLKAAKQ